MDSCLFGIITTMLLSALFLPVILMSVSSAFHIVSVRDGIPYLNNQTLHVSENQLVLNDGHSPELGVTAVQGHLYSTQQPIEEELYIDPCSGAILTSESKSRATALPGHWGVNATGFINFNNESNIWACAYGKSGIYKLYWSENFNPSCLAGQKIWLKRAD